MKSQLVTLEMRHDLAWWQTFLPLYNGVSVIKLQASRLVLC